MEDSIYVRAMRGDRLERLHQGGLAELLAGRPYGADYAARLRNAQDRVSYLLATRAITTTVAVEKVLDPTRREYFVPYHDNYTDIDYVRPEHRITGQSGEWRPFQNHSGGWNARSHYPVWREVFTEISSEFIEPASVRRAWDELELAERTTGLNRWLEANGVFVSVSPTLGEATSTVMRRKEIERRFVVKEFSKKSNALKEVTWEAIFTRLTEKGIECRSLDHEGKLRVGYYIVEILQAAVVSFGYEWHDAAIPAPELVKSPTAGQANVVSLVGAQR